MNEIIRFSGHISIISEVIYEISGRYLPFVLQLAQNEYLLLLLLFDKDMKAKRLFILHECVHSVLATGNYKNKIYGLYKQ